MRNNPVTLPVAGFSRLSRQLRRRTRSRSVLELLLIGFVLVAAPLAAGLLVSGHQVMQDTLESEQVLERTTEQTRLSGELAQRLVAVERAARQYRVLRDAEAADNLGQQREALHRRIHSLLALTSEPALVDRLDRLGRRETRLAEQTMAPGDESEWSNVLDAGFRELDGLARELQSEVDDLTLQAQERLQQMGRQARTTSLMNLALLIPLAIGMALLFAFLINRPIRRLDLAIRALARPEAGPVARVRTPRDLRALSVRLEWARRKLRRIEQDRQRLLGQVSHELKTPLSAIQEGLSLLDDQLVGPLDERQHEVVGILKSNADRLQDQIDSILRYNRLRSGSRPQHLQAVEIERLIADTLDHRRLELTARGTRVQRNVVPGVFVRGDLDMLRTALDNLLSNAVKYSADGGEIGVFTDIDDSTVVIDVRDRGRGIRPSDRVRLFEPFYRGHSSASGSIPGSGLGLSICRDLVRAHGGDVALAERSGWQTTFRIRLPLQQSGETVNKEIVNEIQ
ncbi:MAG: ATP-binding protein [Wenzhouxiangella sp.]